jgi:hypothetical protein
MELKAQLVFRVILVPLVHKVFLAKPEHKALLDLRVQLEQKAHRE